jgi:asparagine N-glycosylation enzyme membrane subunit Stt3
MMRRPLIIAIIAFLAALASRVANAPIAFAGGAPQISPIDELYHWKRMAFSAAHVPQVLEFDPDRAAFCPWPPLYDLTSGAAARILGARDADAVLRRVVWFPPLLGAAFVGIAAFFVTRHFGPLAGTTLALALAASPLLVTQSSIADIDHHFLEGPLTFGVVGAALMARHSSHRAVFLLAAVILAGLFVQTALIIAAGLAFVALIAFTDGRAGSIAFAIAAVAVALYRLTRAAGYPGGPWFLGWTHVVLLAGAAIALRKRPIWIACGVGVALLAFPSLLDGARFFTGDPWLRTIVEFQPIWKARDGDLLSLLVGLGAGALFVWPLAIDAWRRRDALRGTIALFAIIYLLLTLSSRRFWSVGIPLLALAGAVYAWKAKVLALAAVALVPPIQFALWMQYPRPPVDAYEKQWIAAAQFLRGQPTGGRVLAPWWLGHTLDVIGKRSVVIDNFGSMPDPIRFERANEALLSRDETRLADYCAANGVRFVVLTNPLLGTRDAAAVLGLKTNPGRATWWWRTYFSRRAQRFRLAYHDWRPEWQGAWMAHAPAIEIWEFDVRRDR